jgi:hypothetical protein
MPSAQVLPTRGSAGIPFDQTPPTGTTAATAPAPGYP